VWTAAADPRLVTIRRLSIGEPRFPELALLFATEIDARAVQTARDVIVRGTAEGAFRPVDARAAARTLIAALVMQAFWSAHPDLYVPVVGRDGGAISDQTVDLLLAGVAAGHRAGER